MPQPFEVLSLSEGIDHLRAGYRRGLLVPFVGAGLSAPRMRGWLSLVKALAAEADVKDLKLPENPTDQHLILASERVVWQAKARGLSLGNLMAKCLPGTECDHAATPAATAALASVWWPLVLSTNYDRLFLDAFNAMHHDGKRKHDGDRMVALGRGADDSHTVLQSLNQPYRPLLWALQGFLGQSMHGADLQREIVLGFEQYRRATFENAAFRSSFAELFRSRSFFFVGSGLSEEYFKGLFGESIVRLGVHQHAHCALINESDLALDTPWFLHTRLNIVALTYSDKGGKKYSGFAPCLQELAAALNEPPKGGRRFWVRSSLNESVSVDLEPSAIPPSDSENHWIVGSAGRSGGSRLSSGKLLVSGDVPTSLHGPTVAVSDHEDLHRVEGRNVLYAIARKSTVNGRAGRDLRHIADTTARALSFAATNGAKVVSLMILSASTSKGRWPRVFSLIEMLRGIRQYALGRSDLLPLHVIIHDTAAGRSFDRSIAAWQAIESGKLDPSEVLNCEALRFLVEIHLGAETTRLPMYVAGKKSVAQVAQYLGLDKKWGFEVDPGPTAVETHRRSDFELSLLDAGVVPGSTIRFRKEASKI
ncbi:MAG: hypothetical protein CFE43_09320 [Burkholderiales bacterium PBB3]|nr:MAG: hypothetical protein CFE43_09320 [Burkholderiales bacterium PBB3]